MSKHANIAVDEVASIAKALAGPGRLRVVGALTSGELCVCQIVELLELAPSTVSRHMAVLQGAGLVESRKDGRWVYYRLPEEPEPHVAGALKWALETFGATEQDPRDKRKLKNINQSDLEEICRRQRKN
jgi:DNA-binding transcriptional ArsR family regulator